MLTNSNKLLRLWLLQLKHIVTNRQHTHNKHSKQLPLQLSALLRINLLLLINVISIIKHSKHKHKPNKLRIYKLINNKPLHIKHKLLHMWLRRGSTLQAGFQILMQVNILDSITLLQQLLSSTLGSTLKEAVVLLVVVDSSIRVILCQELLLLLHSNPLSNVNNKL